jgi:penicillin-binding protein 1A
MPSKEKSNDSKKRNKKSKKTSRKIWKIILITFLTIFVIGIGLAVGAVVAIVNGAGALSRADFEISDFTTVIYDKYGNEYATLYNAENRYYSSLDDMSPYLPKAFIAIEDERFDTHFGIDVKRTGAAIAKFITTGNSDFGGSTITQQLVKKVTKDDDRSWQRKAREIVRAIQVEQWLTKDQIIELYMNIIYLGSGAYGVETASYTYFNKSATDLTIAEAALIAGLAQAPEGYNPYTQPEKAQNRQKLVLGKMLQCGYISQEQYDQLKMAN